MSRLTWACVQGREPFVRRRQVVLQGRDRVAVGDALAIHLAQLVAGLHRRLGQCRQVPGQLGEAQARLRQLGLQVVAQFPLVAPGCLLGGDLLARGGQAALLFGHGGVQPAQRLFHLPQLAFPRLRLHGVGLERGPLLVELFRLLAQPLAQLPVFLETERHPQFFEAAAVFLMPLGLGRLEFDAPQLLFDLVDDVLEPLQVLIDLFELAQRLDLTSLEAADAGGLLEDGAPVLGRSLQQHVHAPLLDDAVGVVAGAAA